MNLPENDYQILRLTDEFYRAYPNPPYREILKKEQRAYNCLLFHTDQRFITNMHFIFRALLDPKLTNQD